MPQRLKTRDLFVVNVFVNAGMTHFDQGDLQSAVAEFAASASQVRTALFWQLFVVSKKYKQTTVEI